MPRSTPARGRRAQSRRRAQRARHRRAGRALLIATLPSLAVGAVIALALGLALGVLPLAPATDALDDPAAPAAPWPTEASAPVDLAARLSDEQRANAATIIAAGRDLGLSARDQAIGVMTALGESSLRNLDYGDWETSGVMNPDGSRTTSIGLFQQQDGWGTREQRLDPYTSATLFYRAMVARVPDRDAVEPTLVAHRTQINRDPDHYARYWPLAVALWESLTGTESDLAG